MKNLEKSTPSTPETIGGSALNFMRNMGKQVRTTVGLVAAAIAAAGTGACIPEGNYCDEADNQFTPSCICEKAATYEDWATYQQKQCRRDVRAALENGERLPPNIPNTEDPCYSPAGNDQPQDPKNCRE